MTRAHADAPATYYRLSEESWAEIRREYRNGATARQLAGKWRTSASSIYRRACEGGWGKKTDGDAEARAHAAAIAAEEQADLERAWPGARGGARAASLGPDALAELMPEPAPGVPYGAADLAYTAVEGAGGPCGWDGCRRRKGWPGSPTCSGGWPSAIRRTGWRPSISSLFAPGFAEKIMSMEGETAPSPWKRMFWQAKAEREAEGASAAEAPGRGGHAPASRA